VAEGRAEVVDVLVVTETDDLLDDFEEVLTDGVTDDVEVVLTDGVADVVVVPQLPNPGIQPVPQ
jgi:hypothetical protein